MPSAKTIAATRIARSLRPAEVMTNDLGIALFAVGTEVLKARSTGAFRPLENQEAVQHLGRAMALVFDAMDEMVVAHGHLRSTAEQHRLLRMDDGSGDLCPPPTGIEGNVVPLATAA